MTISTGNATLAERVWNAMRNDFAQRRMKVRQSTLSACEAARKD
jgi:hypothetical protein